MFDDFFSTARGPGLIGLLLACVLLAGFSALAITTLDSRFNGDNGTSLRKLISDQEYRIASQQRAIALLSEEVASVQARRDTLAQLEDSARQLTAARATREAAISAHEAAKAQLVEIREAFISYRQAYREAERARAVGEVIPSLQTVDGRTYENVKIKDVSAIGILISHAHGSRRVPFEEFSPEVQDRFQFAANERDEALTVQKDIEKRHAEAVAAAQAAHAQPDPSVSTQADADAIRLELRIRALHREIAALTHQADLESREFASARKAGRVGVNRSTTTRRRINTLRHTLKETERQLRQLNRR